MSDDMVTVDTPTAVIYHGTAYGPGDGIEMPKAAAEQAGLIGDKKAAKAEKKAIKKGRK